MNHSSRVAAEAGTSPSHWAMAAGLAAVLFALLVPRWISIFTESINWDEFTMLARVDRTLRLGDIVGGGRPGLVTLMLTPFVRNCVDAITTAVRARILWQLITLAYLCGVFFLVRNWFRFSRRPENGYLEGAAAVALLAFLPAFVAWSVQVRSDQAALAAAVWGGVCLLSERRRLAVVAGLLFGLALLCTQKAVYSAALCGLLWAMAMLNRLKEPSQVSRNSELAARAGQALLIGLCAAATLAIYAYLVPKTANLVDKGTVVSAWEEMRLARARVGYRAYTIEATRAPLHILLFVTLIITSGRAILRRAYGDYPLLGACWAILLLGMAVAVFHGSSYPYFVMTVGLFPAIALGIASGHLARFLGKSRHAIVGLAFLLLVLGSVPITLEMLDGSQANQRDTMRWIKASGLDAHQGFQVDGALICLTESDPIPPLSHQINMGTLSPTAFDDLIAEFRRRQLAYVVDLGQLHQFPKTVQRFWADHYHWYYGSVSVAGFDIKPGSVGLNVDVVSPGLYRWVPFPRTQEVTLVVDGTAVPAMGSVPLAVGPHRLSTRPSGFAGVLVRAIDLPAGEEVYRFIDPNQLDRLYGVR